MTLISSCARPDRHRHRQEAPWGSTGELWMDDNGTRWVVEVKRDSDISTDEVQQKRTGGEALGPPRQRRRAVRGCWLAPPEDYL